MNKTVDLWIDSHDGTESIPRPPVETRVQVLPFMQLTWENFERLCFRLAWRSGEVSDCRRYGIQGQNQQGIDIFVRRASDNGYSTWQCKRYAELTPTEIREAVDVFLDNDWGTRSTVFKLAVTVSLSPTALAEEVEKQAQKCRQKGIAFEPLDTERLSDLLKVHPDLVDDFFGRPWVHAFCGADAVQRLSGRRLTRQQRIEARQRLGELYTTHFSSVDIGLPAAVGALRDVAPHFPLRDRYVAPLIEVLNTVVEWKSESPEATDSLTTTTEQESLASQRKSSNVEAGSFTGLRTKELRTQSDLFEWLAAIQKGVLLGGPGLGKSAALRFLALDLLSEQPKIAALAQRWGSYLPLFVPFAMLTRLVADEEVVSITDFLRGWLRKLSAPPETAALLEQALDDERLLLLIDGLDEWSDATAARTALVTILDFAGPRCLPVIASARPHGYERLGGLGPDWKKAELLPFESEQQLRFTKAWFEHFYMTTLPDGSKSDAVSSAAIRDTASFMFEVEQDMALSELAGIPLLLSALIYLRLQGRVLPRNRFDAVQAITRALIHDQPISRTQASLQGSSTPQQNPRIAERGIEFLALLIHKQPDSESIHEDKVRETLATFYQGSEFRKSEAEAIELATIQADYAAHEVGILVQRQPGQIGFLHRSLQEFLAAKEIARWPFVQIKEFVVEKSGDPRWQEILLAVLHGMGRQDEVDSILAEIRQLLSDPISFPLRRIFLARIVFSDFNCSAQIAEDLAEEIFSDVELSTWMPLREALLIEVVKGLDSEVLGCHVRNRLRKWFPDRQEHRFGLFQPLADSPVDDTGTTLFFALVNSNSGGEQNEIADAIASGASNWPELGDRLAALLAKPADDELLAFSLHALAIGWPNHQKLPTLLLAARESRADSLSCAAAIHLFRRGDRSPDLKKHLIQFCSRDSGAYWWTTEVVEALSDAWSADIELHTIAFEAAKNRMMPAEWDSRLALKYLVKALPGDNEVAREHSRNVGHDTGQFDSSREARIVENQTVVSTFWFMLNNRHGGLPWVTTIRASR